MAYDKLVKLLAIFGKWKAVLDKSGSGDELAWAILKDIQCAADVPGEPVKKRPSVVYVSCMGPERAGEVWGLIERGETVFLYGDERIIIDENGDSIQYGD